MASPVGFHSEAQFRLDEQRQAIRTSTAPGGSGSGRVATSQTPIFSFHPFDFALRPVAQEK